MLLVAIASPSLACSTPSPDYARTTAESDALIIVEATAATTRPSPETRHPFLPETIGRAEGRIVRQLMGDSRLSSPTTFDFWIYDEACGTDFNVEVGHTYYVWLKRKGDQLVTWEGVDRSDLSWSDRGLIARSAARKR